MTIFDSLKYQISDPITPEETAALPPEALQYVKTRLLLRYPYFARSDVRIHGSYAYLMNLHLNERVSYEWEIKTIKNIILNLE